LRNIIKVIILIYRAIYTIFKFACSENEWLGFKLSTLINYNLPSGLPFMSHSPNRASSSDSQHLGLSLLPLWQWSFFFISNFRGCLSTPLHSSIFRESIIFPLNIQGLLWCLKYLKTFLPDKLIHSFIY
jgi:hypothetical protein